MGWVILGGSFTAVFVFGLILLSFIVFFSSEPPQAADQHPRTAPVARSSHEIPPATQFPGLLAYWNLDEGEGARAADASGNGLHGKLVNTQWVAGQRGKGVHLAGAGSYLDCGDSPKLSLADRAPFTLGFWVKTARPRGTLLSHRNSRDGAPVLDILIENGRVNVQVRQDGSELPAPVMLSGGSVNNNSWHHVALLRDGDVLDLFLDGVSQGRRPGELAAGALTTNLRTLGSERYWISHASFGDPHFEGEMDELCMFNRALKADEIAALAGR
jgi:hypothetical protein